jgi:hypothetical protein
MEGKVIPSVPVNPSTLKLIGGIILKIPQAEMPFLSGCLTHQVFNQERDFINEKGIN